MTFLHIAVSLSIFRSLFLASFIICITSMYLLNNKVSYLKRWCSGVRFAVVHKQSRVRDQLISSIFFFFHFYLLFFFTFLLNLILF